VPYPFRCLRRHEGVERLLPKLPITGGVGSFGMLHQTIPDNIYNWIKAFFEQHYHCTRYARECSTVAAVKASVIQGSGLGPASFIVTAADLHPTTPGNRIFKFANDTYLVVPRRQTQALDWTKYPM